MPFNSGVGGNKVVPLYGGGQVPNPANVITNNVAPSTNNTESPIGTIYVNTATSLLYICVANTGFNGSVTWEQIGTSTGSVGSLTGGSGGAITPVAGNITLAGTANQITTTGTAGTITFSIPSAFTAPGSIAATTSVTAGTTVTATLGAITATNGNLVLGTAGNKIMSTSVASTTTAGANSFGTVTLSGGTATVSTTAVTASSIIMLTRQSIGSTGAAALGQLSVGTVSAGSSFVINADLTATATSLATTDVSVIGWMIIN